MTDDDHGRRVLRAVPVVQHDRYGALPAPEHPDQLLVLLSQLAVLQVGAWRGQADATWGIDSALARRYDHRAWLGPRWRRTEANVRAVEKALFERARSVGFGEGLGDLELLARLQHHGAATGCSTAHATRS